MKTAMLLIGVLLAPMAPAQPSDFCASLDSGILLAQVNAVRERGAACGADRGAAQPMPPAPALRWSPPLQALALQQARWLAGKGQLAHTGPQGETLRQRADAAAYSYTRIAENVGQGQRSVTQVLSGWTASEGHCLNLYDPGVTEMALVCAPGRDGRPFWALLLARPQ
jgi:uncharacterized protein YkwD